MTIKVFTDPLMTRDAFPEMRVGERRIETHGAHTFIITATKEVGCDTGRRRYRVVCRSCAIVVHPMTTGPQWNVGYHLREVARDDVHPFPGEVVLASELALD